MDRGDPPTACRLSIWPTLSIVSKFYHWPPTIGGGRFKTTVDEGQAAHHHEGKEQVVSQSLNPKTQKINFFAVVRPNTVLNRIEEKSAFNKGESIKMDAYE